MEKLIIINNLEEYWTPVKAKLHFWLCVCAAAPHVVWGQLHKRRLLHLTVFYFLHKRLWYCSNILLPQSQLNISCNFHVIFCMPPFPTFFRSLCHLIQIKNVIFTEKHHSWKSIRLFYYNNNQMSEELNGLFSDSIYGRPRNGHCAVKRVGIVYNYHWQRCRNKGSLFSLSSAQQIAVLDAPCKLVNLGQI